MNTSPLLKFPPGIFAIEDECQAVRTLAELGVPDLLPPDGQANGPITCCLFYEDHPSHWLLVGAHKGYADPAKNGHEIVGLPRSQFRPAMRFGLCAGREERSTRPAAPAAR